MNDDSLNDTQRGIDKMVTNVYCPMCDTVYDTNHSKCRCIKSNTISLYDSIVRTKANPESSPTWENIAQKEFNSSQYGSQACDMTKTDSVGIKSIKDADGFVLDMNNPVVKEIWNAAIEAAAIEAMDSFTIDKYDDGVYISASIRKLKK